MIKPDAKHQCNLKTLTQHKNQNTTNKTNQHKITNQSQKYECNAKSPKQRNQINPTQKHRRNANTKTQHKSIDPTQKHQRGAY